MFLVYTFILYSTQNYTRTSICSSIIFSKRSRTCVHHSRTAYILKFKEHIFTAIDSACSFLDVSTDYSYAAPVYYIAIRRICLISMLFNFRWINFRYNIRSSSSTKTPSKCQVPITNMTAQERYVRRRCALPYFKTCSIPGSTIYLFTIHKRATTFVHDINYV